MDLSRAAVGMVRQGLPGAGVAEFVSEYRPHVRVRIGHQGAQGGHQDGPDDVQVTPHCAHSREQLLRGSIQAVLEG